MGTVLNQAKEALRTYEQVKEDAKKMYSMSVAMAIEAEVPAIIGESMLIQSLIDGFKNYIVRPDDLEDMMGIACNS